MKSYLNERIASSGIRALVPILAALSLAIGLIGCDAAEEVQGAGSFESCIEPPSNPDCAYLASEGLLDEGWVEFKIDPPLLGTHVYVIDNAGNTVTVTTEDGIVFDWSSSLGMDAVISKGGPGGLFYFYDPEAFGDEDLVSPDNPSGGPAAISHINFCFDYEVEVEKTATTSYERVWSWTIDKSSADSALVLASGESYSELYTVEVGFASKDQNYAVSGEITIGNPSPFTATIIAVTDTMGDQNVPIVCPALPAELRAGETMTCTYAQPLPDGAQRLNEVVVETEGLVGGNEAEADVIFGEPTTETDECAELNDSLEGSLGGVCASGTIHTFLYYHAIVGGECGSDTTVENIATLVTNDTGTTLSDNALVDVTVPPCDVGCTLTQGYWKTHSEFGPAPYDDVWATLPDKDESSATSGASEPFFKTGYSYYEILWMPPRGGNAYLTLAHQFIAAELNRLAGASAPGDVVAAYDQARSLLDVWAGSLYGFKGKNASELRALFIQLAGVLGSYNEGAIGPGHCNEDHQSSGTE